MRQSDRFSVILNISGRGLMVHCCIAFGQYLAEDSHMQMFDVTDSQAGCFNGTNTFYISKDQI